MGGQINSDLFPVMEIEWFAFYVNKYNIEMIIEPRVQYWEEYCTRSTNQIAEVLCVSTISNKGTSSFFISNKDGLSRILFLKRVCYVKAFGKGLAVKGLSYSSNCFSWPLSTSWQIQRNISRFSIISLELWS